MIYFCLPGWNESPTVGLVLWKIHKVLAESPREYQFLVGDDGSTDDTREVLERYAKALPITVITHRERRGYAAMVERLLREALERSDRHKRDVAILLPADFSADPADLPAFLQRIDSGADVIVGEATLRGEPDRWLVRARRWAPRLVARSTRVDGVRDIVSGFLAIRLVALRNAYRDRTEPWFTVDGWAANAQLIAWSAAGARRVEVTPVTETADRMARPRRHTGWARLRALWSSRRASTPPPAAPRAERPPRRDTQAPEAA